REPGTRDRGVRQRTAQAVAVALVAAVGRVAHPVEALPVGVVRSNGDELAGAVRLTRRLDPDIGVDAGGRVGLRPLAEARTGLVAPVAGVDAPVDARLVDERVQIGRRAGSGGPRRLEGLAGGLHAAAPAVTGGVDEHADVRREALADQAVAEGL